MAPSPMPSACAAMPIRPPSSVLHGNLEALALLAEHVLLGDDAVLEDQVGGGTAADAHLLLVLALMRSRGKSFSTMKAEIAFVGLPQMVRDLVSRRRSTKVSASVRVGDEALGAVEDVVLAGLIQNLAIVCWPGGIGSRRSGSVRPKAPSLLAGAAGRADTSSSAPPCRRHRSEQQHREVCAQTITDGGAADLSKLFNGTWHRTRLSPPADRRTSSGTWIPRKP